jgi:DNA-binding transcriptional MerR regulator
MLDDIDTHLPTIPDKRYFTIGETSILCGIKPHVLRYWEQEFPQLRPSTRRGNRRYYQHKDVVLVRQIRSLLYEQGFTISGARQQISQLKKQVIAPATVLMPTVETVNKTDKSLLDEVCTALEKIAGNLSIT